MKCKHNNYGFCLWCEAEKKIEQDNKEFDQRFLGFINNLFGYPEKTGKKIEYYKDPNKLADAMVELQFKNGNLTRENLEKYKIKRDIEDLEKLANGKS